jgi:4-hydroxy-tetrahydrodipicolinate synthase
VPSRTVADMSTDTTMRLAQLPNVVGIKDATGDLARGTELLRRVRAEVQPKKSFAVYSGNDDSALALTLVGGDGVISVTANVAPKEMADLYRHALAGAIDKAIEINDKLSPLHFKLFVEANPIPVKWILKKMGRCGAATRLPMTPMSTHLEAVVEDAMRQSGLI